VGSSKLVCDADRRGFGGVGGVVSGFACGAELPLAMPAGWLHRPVVAFWGRMVLGCVVLLLS
jgi:hypothetical protein